MSNYHGMQPRNNLQHQGEEITLNSKREKILRNQEGTLEDLIEWK